jgi:hypothetical protein
LSLKFPAAIALLRMWDKRQQGYQAMRTPSRDSSSAIRFEFTFGCRCVGLVRSSASLHWVPLTRQGLREADFNLREAVPPFAAGLCG